MKKSWKWLSSLIFSHYSILLYLLVLLFIFRPYEQGLLYHAAWKLVLAGAFFSAIFNCHHHKIVKIITFILAIPSLILSWTYLLFPHEIFFVTNALITISFMIICASSILYDVVLRARVTLETLRGVICAFFMVAFSFAYAYYLIEYLYPGSFNLESATLITNRAQYLSEMFYFSFITLLAIGYGDITAKYNIAQTACVLEGIIGQFYVAILVARLVAVYSFYADKKLMKNLEKEIREELEELQ